MVKCPNCSEGLEKKSGTKKLCAQIGNSEIAIVETNSPHFCNTCNEYFLSTDEIISTIVQINKFGSQKQNISAGIYS